MTINNLATQYWHRMVEMEKTLNEALRRIDSLEKLVQEKDRIILLRDERIEELEEEVRKLKGTGKKLKEILFKPEEKKEGVDKRGAKKGHQSFFRRKPTPEEITEHKKVTLSCCPDCKETLRSPHSFRNRYSIDLPPPQKPQIIEWQCARYQCHGCKHWVQAQPAGVFGKSPFGITLMMKVLDMKYRGKDTDEYIQESLKRWHGIDLSDGGIHTILNRAAELFGPSYEAIKQALCEGKIVQVDETGWRVAGENWFAWAFLNSEVTFYQIEDTRGGGIPKETLKEFSGVLVSDAYQGYSAVERVEKAICGIHFLRHTHEIADFEEATEEAKEFHRNMVWFFRVARRKKRNCQNDEQRIALYSQMKTAFERYWKDITYRDPFVEKTRHWWLEVRGDQLLTFLKYEHVPWDNNAAERAVRPMVRRRKITGGSRSARGAEREAINMSCITTLLKQGKNLFTEIPRMFAMTASANS
jgi:hypothetical protein